ncbi:helix-turn-helix domain-containing protein [Paraburkholderia tropica]|uniref:helix-turn-helix domain-containing protein n=1 Tax=Paraburkholderia tropica TaxID=92647 RepID=UPI0032B3873A
MVDIDDVIRRLRHRASNSRGQAESLEWIAADALERLTQALEQLPATRTAAPAQRPNMGEGNDEPVDIDAKDRSPISEGKMQPERALTLQEAADLLHVSRRTVYDHRDELGFFQVGSAWRVWPEKLREATKSGGEKPKQEPAERLFETKQSLSNVSMSARDAEIELDKLLAQRRRPHRRKQG